jgi:hypothetical protein
MVVIPPQERMVEIRRLEELRRPGAKLGERPHTAVLHQTTVVPLVTLGERRLEPRLLIASKATA